MALKTDSLLMLQQSAQWEQAWCVSECRNEWVLCIPSTGELSVGKDLSVTIHSSDCLYVCVCA